MGIVIVKGALHFGFVHKNPLYQFVLLLQFAVPPAMNIGLIIILVKLQIYNFFICFCLAFLPL